MEDLEAKDNTPLARSTLIVQDRHAQHHARLQAAREGRQGLQVMTIDQMVVRLAGGYCRSIDGATLRAAVQNTLANTPLSELESIRQLPGMIDATTSALQKIWASDFAFADELNQQARLQDIRCIEEDVLKHLPSGMMRPADLVATALPRLVHAPAVLGSVRFQGITHIPDCWRQLIIELARHVHVTWHIAPHCQPDWLDNTPVSLETAPQYKPAIELFSTATRTGQQSVRCIPDTLTSSPITVWPVRASLSVDGENKSFAYERAMDTEQATVWNVCARYMHATDIN